MKRIAWSCLAMLLLVVGCATPTGTVRRRAAAEFRCPEDAVRVEKISGGAYRVFACGREAIYICVAQNHNWICSLDSMVSGGEQPGAPAPDGCNPPCSPGFACSQGQCMPLCNPPCPAGMWCTQNRTCAPVTQEQTAPPPPPAQQQPAPEEDPWSAPPPPP